jgi:hypothetical protein
MLHLMRRAHALVTGTNPIPSKVWYMWIATDASPKRKQDCILYCQTHDIPFEIAFLKADYRAIMQQRDVAVIRLINPHFIPLIYSNKEELLDEKQS